MVPRSSARNAPIGWRGFSRCFPSFASTSNGWGGEILEMFPILREHFKRLAGMLSGGEQQVLAIARGMMSKPRILMIDEPSLGLDPQKIDIVYDLLEAVAATGTTVLLVEQNVNLALEIATRAYVLQQGSVVLSGESSALAADPRLSAAYLGEVDGKVR